MLRRIQLSAALAVGGFALVSVLTVGCSDRPGGGPAASGALGPAVAGAEEPKPTRSTARHQNYTETLDGPEGKVSFDMVAIPGGEFGFGSSPAEDERKEDEGPQVKVRLKPFWMGRCEVTWDEFDLYFRYGNKNLEKKDGDGEATEEKKPDEPGDPSLVKKDDTPPASPADAVSKPTRPYVDETYGYEREKNPAICMTHHAAMKYCEWLSKKTGKDYRLPTEAEWEYACRAGTTGAFGIAVGAKLEDHAWFKANSRDMAGRLAPHAVGTKKANAWGLHDMHGNVMEWCLDHYVKNAHALSGKRAGKDGFVLSPVFAPTENKWAHVARGGHFKDEPKDLRSAARRKSEKKWMAADPQEPQSIWWLTNYPIIGFRVVRPVEPDELTGITSKVVKENDEEFKP